MALDHTRCNKKGQIFAALSDYFFNDRILLESIWVVNGPLERIGARPLQSVHKEHSEKLETMSAWNTHSSLINRSFL